MVATAYGPPWGGIEGSGVTATGVPLRPGLRVIAVDPAVIPLGSRLRVWPNPLGTRRTFTAADTGGAIRGGRIDVFDWHGPAAMSRWGIRQVHVCNTTKEKP
jgi:3D (Asp-Asp-Asp) domain-containing protein